MDRTIVVIILGVIFFVGVVAGVYYLIKRLINYNVTSKKSENKK